jgi:extradiol dioxygenase family protein
MRIFYEESFLFFFFAFKSNNIEYLDEPYTRFKGKKEEQETFFIKDPHGNILELKTLQNS